MRRGWCKDVSDFDFARCYSDFLYTRFSASRSRCALTTQTLQGQVGQATPLSLMAALRQHQPDAPADWSPARGLLDSTVCMHAGPGPARGSQTTGSLVAYLHPDRPTLFVTGTAAPCTSIFKPLWLDTPLPDLGPAPAGTFDPQTLFWRHEWLHRAVLADYPARSTVLAAERDALEQEFVAAALAIANRPASERAEFVADCFAPGRRGRGALAGAGQRHAAARPQRAALPAGLGRLRPRGGDAGGPVAQVPDWWLVLRNWLGKRTASALM